MVPMRCRFGASHGPPTNSVTAREGFACICVWVASNEVCASMISMCALTENGCFVLLVMMFFFGGVVVVSLVQLSTILCVFTTRQDEAFSSRRNLVQTHTSCCDWQPYNFEFAAPDSCFKEFWRLSDSEASFSPDGEPRLGFGHIPIPQLSKTRRVTPSSSKWSLTFLPSFYNTGSLLNRLSI